MKEFFKTDRIYRIVCLMIRLFCSALIAAGVITVIISFIIDSVLLGIRLNIGSISISWAFLTLVIFLSLVIFRIDFMIIRNIWKKMFFTKKE